MFLAAVEVEYELYDKTHENWYIFLIIVFYFNK